MSTIKNVRKAVREQHVTFSDHALEEMDNDDLTLADVRTVLVHGALHKRYDDDPRGLRFVVRGGVDDQDVDVVCRFLTSGVLWIITVYVVTEGEENE